MPGLAVSLAVHAFHHRILPPHGATIVTASALRIATFTGDAITALLPALADLRVEVFRDWPYLYDGDPAYERDYLSVYATEPRAMLAVAFDDDKIIGASTCLPMTGAAPEIRAPLAAQGLTPDGYFYFGESILLATYRGRGLGVKFFAAREAHALSDGVCGHALFYAVRRAVDHPARPVNARSLDSFWRKRGYRPAPGLSCQMSWREIGMTAEIIHTLDAWCKPLKAAP